MHAETVTVIAAGSDLDLARVAHDVQRQLKYPTSNVRKTRDGARFDVLIDQKTALLANEDETVRNRVVMSVLGAAGHFVDKHGVKVEHLGVQGWGF